MRSLRGWILVAAVGWVGCTPIETQSYPSTSAGEAAAPVGGAGAPMVAVAGMGMAMPMGTPTMPAAGSGNAAAGGNAETPPDPAAGGGARPGKGGGPVAGVGASSGTQLPGGPVAGSAAAPSGMPNAPAQPGEVRGKVVDLYFQPVANVQVTIGTTTVTTGAAGDFAIPGAGPTYDLTLLVTVSRGGSNAQHVWRYEGLTRRDPTLQVEESGDGHSAAVSLSFSGIDFATRQSGDQVLTSFGSASGVYNSSDEVASASFMDDVFWRGPSRARFTVHALRLLKLPGRIEATDFYSYDDFTLDLSDGGSASASLDLPLVTVLGGGTLAGAIQTPPGSTARVQLYMRWPDYATMQLVDDESITEAFNYSIPNTPGGTITLMAITMADDIVRVVHVDGLTTQSDYVMLPLPTESTLIAPEDAARVDAQTAFQWSGSANLYLLRISAVNENVSYQVVTANRQARLPIHPDVVLGTGRAYTWWIETHGPYASVDQATGPKGFLDTCVTRDPIGPERGTGTYTESVGRRFVTP